MRIENATPLALGFFPSQTNSHGQRMTCVAKATLRFDDTGAVSLVERTLALGLTGDEVGPGGLRYASDFAPYKPRADVLLSGTCHPRDRKARQATVSMRVGRIERQLTIYGERAWLVRDGHAVPGEPSRVHALALGYQHAFGAPDHARNPVGTGHSEKGGTPAGPPPRIEDPRFPVRRATDEVPPAGFGPLDPRWADRSGKLGTYDDAWQRDQWPLLPHDFDWSHFNAAPADQQISGYLRGTEKVVLEGLHQTVERVTFDLPGLRPRCLLRRADAALEEVALALDTLFIDADEGLVALVWRGNVAVANRHLDDVAMVGLALELAGSEARALSSYANDPAFQPEPVKAPEELAEGPAAPATTESMDADAARRAAERNAKEDEALMAESLALLRKNGADADLLAKLEATASLAAFVAVLQAAQDPVDRKAAEELAEAERARTFRAMEDDESYAQLREALSDEQPEVPPPTPGRRVTRDEVVDLLTRDGSLVGIDVSGEDLSGLNLQNRDLSHANLARVELGGANLAGARLEKASLRGVTSKTPVDLSRANLQGADLRDARLEAANLELSDLGNVNATRSRLDGARLSGAALTGAVLDEAHLQRADLSSAALAGARLSGVIAAEACFEGADLTRAVLVGAELSRCRLDQAELGNARLAGATLTQASLAGASLRGADLSDADLTGARATGANLSLTQLDRARLDDADLTEVLLAQARGHGVSMHGARLTRLRAAHSVLPRLDASDTVADESVWLGAQLGDAVFSRSRLEAACFNQAELARASFDLAVMKRADLARASLTGATLTRVNLFRATLTGADLGEADVRGSNLYECELWEANTAGARLARTNLRRTKLENRA